MQVASFEPNKPSVDPDEDIEVERLRKTGRLKQGEMETTEREGDGGRRERLRLAGMIAESRF